MKIKAMISIEVEDKRMVEAYAMIKGISQSEIYVKGAMQVITKDKKTKQLVDEIIERGIKWFGAEL